MCCLWLSFFGMFCVKKIMIFCRRRERDFYPIFDVNLIILNLINFEFRPLTVESLHRVSPLLAATWYSLKSRPNTKCLNLEIGHLCRWNCWGHVKRHDKLQLAIKNKRLVVRLVGSPNMTFWRLTGGLMSMILKIKSHNIAKWTVPTRVKPRACAIGGERPLVP